MSCDGSQARDDRKAACRECRRDTNHRVIAQHDTSQTDIDIGIEWTHHTLVECRGCGSVSYEYSFEFTDNLDENGELYTTRRSYPSRADELPEGLVVVLMTDIVDSTSLTETLGDAVFRAKAGRLHEQIAEKIRLYDGVPAEGNVLGDGILSVFKSTSNALAAAIGCVERATANGFQLHVGIHAGDVMKADQTVYGGAVNIAARVTTMSKPNEILVTETVRGLARTSTSLRFDARGAQKLKGIEEPLTLYAIRADEDWNNIVPIEFE